MNGVRYVADILNSWRILHVTDVSQSSLKAMLGIPCDISVSFTAGGAEKVPQLRRLIQPEKTSLPNDTSILDDEKKTRLKLLQFLKAW